MVDNVLILTSIINKKAAIMPLFYLTTWQKMSCLAFYVTDSSYQNFHQGFLPAKWLAADVLLIAAVEAAALVTLSFRQPFSSRLGLYHKHLLQI